MTKTKTSDQHKHCTMCHLTHAFGATLGGRLLNGWPRFLYLIPYNRPCA